MVRNRTVFACNCVYTDDWYLIGLLLIHSNTFNYWIVRNRTVWSFNCVYLQNVFRNLIFDIYVKTVFGIK